MEYKHVALFHAITASGFKRISSKAFNGQGRRLPHWKKELYVEWRDEFDRLRKVGVKFNFPNLVALGTHVVFNSNSSHFSANMIDENSGNRLLDMISLRFVQYFADARRIRSRAQTGKKRLSPAKEIELEKDVAYHLGQVYRMFRDKVVDENDAEIADETHFVIDMDNGTTLDP